MQLRLVTRRGYVRVALALLQALALQLSAAHAAGDPDRGRAKSATCAACHGADGNSVLEGIPSLAGQPETFVTLQLILFREDIRQVPAMQEPVRGLSDDDLADLAAYYAKLAPRSNPGSRDASAFGRGRGLAQSGRCGTCHLADYSGRDQMPRLAHQREDYLLHSMIEYRDNKRAGTDTSMNAVLYGMSDADLRALAHYLARLR